MAESRLSLVMAVLALIVFLVGIVVAASGAVGLEADYCPVTGGGRAYATINVPIVVPPGIYTEARTITVELAPVGGEGLAPGTYTTSVELPRECEGTLLLASVVVYGEWWSANTTPQIRVVVLGDGVVLSETTITQPFIAPNVTTQAPANVDSTNATVRAVAGWEGDTYRGSFEIRVEPRIPPPRNLTIQVTIDEPVDGLYVGGVAELLCEQTVEYEEYRTTVTPVSASFYADLTGSTMCLDYEALRTTVYGVILMIVGVGLAVFRSLL